MMACIWRSLAHTVRAAGHTLRRHSGTSVESDSARGGESCRSRGAECWRRVGEFVREQSSDITATWQ